MKDKTNVLTYNQWSCTDYLNNVNGFHIGSTNAIKIESSNNYSHIGENSLRLIPINTSILGRRIRVYYEKELINKQLNLTVTIKTNRDSSSTIMLVEEKDNNIIKETFAQIPENTCKTIILSLKTSSNNGSSYFIQVNNPSLEYTSVYVDNINLMIS